MKIRHILMGAGLLLGAWLALFGDTTPEHNIAEPVQRAQDPHHSHTTTLASAAEIPHSERTAQKQELMILALEARETLIGGEAREETTGLFGSNSWTPPPLPPATPPPPPPPSAPPVPFSYLGKKLEDGIWEVFLSRGEETIIVRTASVIDDKYRVDAIKPPTLSLIYLPLNQMQTIAIGGTD
jgi:hypothetical protein